MLKIQYTISGAKTIEFPQLTLLEPLIINEAKTIRFAAATLAWTPNKGSENNRVPAAWTPNNAWVVLWQKYWQYWESNLKQIKVLFGIVLVSSTYFCLQKKNILVYIINRKRCWKSVRMEVVWENISLLKKILTIFFFFKPIGPHN